VARRLAAAAETVYQHERALGGPPHSSAHFACVNSCSVIPGAILTRINGYLASLRVGTKPTSRTCVGDLDWIDAQHVIVSSTISASFPGAIEPLHSLKFAWADSCVGSDSFLCMSDCSVLAVEGSAGSRGIQSRWDWWSAFNRCGARGTPLVENVAEGRTAGAVVSDAAFGRAVSIA